MRNISLLLAFLFSVVAFAQQNNPTVNVTGEGSVYVVPDKVVIQARLEHLGESASEVKRQNDKVVNTIFEYLKEQGIPSKNVQTEYIRLNKEYDYNSKEYSYSANQAISIQLDDLSKYEEVMSGLLESGLNRIDGVQFKTSRKNELESEARKKAMLDSRQKATELAGALGQQIGTAIQINEVGTNGFQPMARTMEMKSSDSSEGQTIAPGEMEVIVTVNVSYLLH